MSPGEGGRAPPRASLRAPPRAPLRSAAGCSRLAANRGRRRKTYAEVFGAAGREDGGAARRRAVTAGCRRGAQRQEPSSPPRARGPRGASAGSCPPARSARGSTSHPQPILSRPGKQRTDFPNSLKCGRESGFPAPRRPCALAPPLCPGPRGTRVAPGPSPRARRGRGSGGTQTGAAASGADAVAEGRAPAAAGCPFPGRAPGALRWAPCGARCGVRGAPGAFPGQPRIFRNLPPGAAGTGPAARPEEPRWTEGRLQYVLFREALHHPP